VDNGFWHKVIEKGRVAEWIIAGGGIALCILGGLNGFLDSQAIGSIILAMVAAVFGVESISSR